MCIHDQRLSVDVRGPVAQVENEEKNWEDDAGYFVHFADAVVGLLGLCVGVIHFMQIGVFGRGSGGAFGNGGQTLVFGHVDGVGRSDDVEGVVCLFGESCRFPSLRKEKGSGSKRSSGEQRQTQQYFHLNS